MKEYNKKMRREYYYLKYGGEVLLFRGAKANENSPKGHTPAIRKAMILSRLSGKKIMLYWTTGPYYKRFNELRGWRKYAAYTKKRLPCST